MSAVGVVAIGRNEGERLVRCLRSIGRAKPTVYVDSGSTDGSVARAAELGVRVVALDMSVPFTAARARNAGRAALGGEAAFIQFVDGDCVLQPGWLDAAVAALAKDAGLAAVFGRRREVAPAASAYNWLCDVEWAVPPGEALYFGGDVMMRADALDAVGGYPDAMIAGEEPDLAIRLRAAGWHIRCLPVEMTLHDAAIARMRQWWRRAERSGHAYAELFARHGGDYGRRLRGSLAWTLMPVAGVIVVLTAVPRSPLLATLGVVLLALPVAQFARLALRERQRWPLRQAVLLAGFLMLAKPAQAIGAARYLLNRLRGRRARLIEYKGAAA